MNEADGERAGARADSSGLGALVEALSSPSAYPHPAPDVEVRRTHISVVFLAGDFAYKIKKPIELGFVDYGSLERRRHFCEEEVRLNRRLAPEVYLGVVPVRERDGGLRVAVAEESETGAREGPGPDGPERGPGPDEGTVREWAVRMRRLPEDRTLETLLARDAVGRAELEKLAAHLAEFHARAERGPEIARYGRFETVAGNARDNFTQSEDQVGSIVHPEVFGRLSDLTDSALERHRERIESRADRGVPCDGHGDLRLDHVYFLPARERPLIVDCIEFNEAFRHADPVADMAFLVMDLRRAGRRDLARISAEGWFDRSGDEEGRRLLEFYVAYRAAVRGKVQGIKAAAGDVPEGERREAGAIATGHWLLALGALAAPRERPALILVGGLPATGKSTLARELARRAGFRVIRSDAIRKELAGLDPGTSAAAPYGAGIYTEEWSDRTYDECRRRAERILFEGGRAIVDASFHRESRRRAFVESAVRHGVAIRFLVCEADPGTARGRIRARSGDASDADREVYSRMRDRWEPPGPSVARLTRAVSTDGSPEESARAALAILAEAELV